MNDRSVKGWCPEWDSNPRLTVLETAALTSLSYRGMPIVYGHLGEIGYHLFPNLFKLFQLDLEAVAVHLA